MIYGIAAAIVVAIAAAIAIAAAAVMNDAIILIVRHLVVFLGLFMCLIALLFISFECKNPIPV
jgi:hypothetical protein